MIRVKHIIPNKNSNEKMIFCFILIFYIKILIIVKSMLSFSRAQATSHFPSDDEICQNTP